MTIIITHPTKTPTPGYLADAAIHFGTDDGFLAGAKLIGFTVWERRGGTGRNVKFPARTYSVQGERRSFALIRPSGDGQDADASIRAAILAAYDAASVREVLRCDDAGLMTVTHVAEHVSAAGVSLRAFWQEAAGGDRVPMPLAAVEAVLARMEAVQADLVAISESIHAQMTERGRK